MTHRNMYASQVAVMIFLLTLPLVSFSTNCHPAGEETLWDCPWAEWTRELEHQPATSIVSGLTQKAPDFTKDVSALNSPEGMQIAAQWGKSLNFDSNARAQIVPRAFLQALHFLSGIQIEFAKEHVVHAGMEHVYGYLFSNLSTPYGYKRWRWTNPEIWTELNVPSSAQGPRPKEGTFLGNVTYLMLAAAHRGTDLSFSGADLVSDSLKQAWNIESLNQFRIKETVEVGDQKISLQTDLLEFSEVDGKNNDALLIYSINQGSENKLITAFPISASFYRSLRNKPSGHVEGIKLRYNGFHDSLSGKTFSGYRTTSKVE